MSGLFGCIADDITGGTDLAGALYARGHNVLQILADHGSLDLDFKPNSSFDAIVVSMKIRSIPADQASAAALAAHSALAGWGADRFYFKYCSTFDSTVEGNIGPVASRLHEVTRGAVVPFCPSFPANGRSLYMGHLFVGDTLIGESPMRNHPLNPMYESDMRKWLALQSPGEQVGGLYLDTVRNGRAAVERKLGELADSGTAFCLLDATSNEDIDVLANACRGLPLTTGGSAFGAALCRAEDGVSKKALQSFSLPKGQPAAIISGSCSAATQEQVERAAKFLPVIKVDPSQFGTAQFSLDAVIEEAATKVSEAGTVLISSTAAENIRSANSAGVDALAQGQQVEQTMARIASALRDRGVRNFITAGGETSGAVCSALGLRELVVGPHIAPGVPWMRDAREGEIHLACKSGNFGSPDFFRDALEMLGLAGDAD